MTIITVVIIESGWLLQYIFYYGICSYIESFIEIIMITIKWYVEMPDFYADILSLSSYLHIPSLYVIHGWHARVARSMRGVGCEVGKENK